jgi:hypothetical protein
MGNTAGLKLKRRGPKSGGLEEWAARRAERERILMMITEGRGCCKGEMSVWPDSLGL